MVVNGNSIYLPLFIQDYVLFLLVKNIIRNNYKKCENKVKCLEYVFKKFIWV